MLYIQIILDSDVLPPATGLPEGTDIFHTVSYCMSWEKIHSSFRKVSQLLNIVFLIKMWSKTKPLKHFIFHTYINYSSHLRYKAHAFRYIIQNYWTHSIDLILMLFFCFLFFILYLLHWICWGVLSKMHPSCDSDHTWAALRWLKNLGMVFLMFCSLMVPTALIQTQPIQLNLIWVGS